LRLLQPSLCGVRLLLEYGQGGILFLEGSLRAPNGRLLLSKGGVLLREGCGERGDGRFLALELGLLGLELSLLGPKLGLFAPELGCLRFEHLVPLLECLILLTKLGRLLFDHLGLVLGCGSLSVALVAGLGQPLLPHKVPPFQLVHLGVDFAYLLE